MLSAGCLEVFRAFCAPCRNDSGRFIEDIHCAQEIPAVFATQIAYKELERGENKEGWISIQGECNTYGSIADTLIWDIRTTAAEIDIGATTSDTGVHIGNDGKEPLKWKSKCR